MTFTGRMLETANYNKSVGAGKMVPTITIAHVAPNDWSMSEQMVGIMNFYDNTNVWTWKLGPEDKPDEGQYLAVTDWPQVHEVDPHTLAIKVCMRLFWIIARDSICFHPISYPILLRQSMGSVLPRVSPWRAQPTGEERLGRTRRCSTT